MTTSSKCFIISQRTIKDVINVFGFAISKDSLNDIAFERCFDEHDF